MHIIRNWQSLDNYNFESYHKISGQLKLSWKKILSSATSITIAVVNEPIPDELYKLIINEIHYFSVYTVKINVNFVLCLKPGETAIMPHILRLVKLINPEKYTAVSEHNTTIPGALPLSRNPIPKNYLNACDLALELIHRAPIDEFVNAMNA